MSFLFSAAFCEPFCLTVNSIIVELIYVTEGWLSNVGCRVDDDDCNRLLAGDTDDRATSLVVDMLLLFAVTVVGDCLVDCGGRAEDECTADAVS